MSNLSATHEWHFYHVTGAFGSLLSDKILDTKKLSGIRGDYMYIEPSNSDSIPWIRQYFVGEREGSE